MDFIKYLYSFLMPLFLKIFFCGSIFFSATNGYSQQNWLTGAGGNGNDEALDNAVDKNGNIYTTGYFSLPAKFGNQSLNSSGSGDVFISKQNSEGTYLWTIKAGGAYSDRGYGISADSSGNVFVAGTFSGAAVFGNITLYSFDGSEDVFVAKLDSSGNFTWVKQFGGNDVDLVSSIVADKQGNPVITGNFRGASQFGSYLFNSAYNPLTLLPSYDIFIARLDTAGNITWAKQGKAPNDDRGMDLTLDNLGFIYLAGQFSGSLEFANVYPNNAYNVSFLMKLDNSGNEIWFRKFLASQVTIYGLGSDGDNIYATGNFDGQLGITGTTGAPPTIIASSYPNKIFAAKLDTGGAVVWAAANGSDNSISALDISADSSGNAYIIGNFSCVLTEYSALYGEAIFNSIGFRDIFISKFDSSGTRAWERQFGGPGDEYGASICTGLSDKPVIAGSFEKNFNAPDGGNFIFNSSNSDLSYLGPAQDSNYCSDDNYFQYISICSDGSKDIFSGNPVDLTRLPYDFYDRWGPLCERNIVTPYINNNEDSVFACDSALLRLTSRTGKDGTIGPAYDYFWSNGSEDDSIYVTASGWYSIILNHKDGCRSFKDSIYAGIFITPPDPLITTSIGTIEQAIPAYGCLNKLIVVYPDFPTFSCSNIPPGYDYSWQTPAGIIYNDSAIADIPGIYYFTVQTKNGLCQSTSCVEVLMYKVGTSGQCLPDIFVPEIHFFDSLAEATDTVKICPGNFFDLILTDSSYWVDGDSLYLPTFVNWSISGGFEMVPYLSFFKTFNYHYQDFRALYSGDGSVTAIVEDPLGGPPLATVTRNFYLLVYPPPPLFPEWNGLQFFCPGDTALLTITGGPASQFSGPGIEEISATGDSIWVTRPGEYFAKCYAEDTITGCMDSTEIVFHLETSPQPLLTLDPANGLICPGDSVQLMADSGSSYHWYGPLEEIQDSSQVIYVSSPGFYHYDFIDKYDCPLVSEFKELKEYSTPNIMAEPNAVLCTGDSITLTIETNDSSIIDWQIPLSGNNPTQVIDTPGTFYCTIFSCGMLITDSVIIVPSALMAEITPAGPDTICPGDTLLLSANPDMVYYNWQPVNGDSSFVFATEPGWYELEIKDIYGCISYDSALIDTFTAPFPPIVSDTVLCAGDSVTLHASAPGIITWHDSQESDSAVFTGSDFILFPDTTTSFYVKNSDSVCSSQAVQVTVFVNQVSLLPSVSGDSLICRGDTLVLSGEAIDNANYSWTGPMGFTGNLKTIEIFPFDSMNAGIYFFHAFDSVCTSQAVPFQVELFPIPDVQIFTDDSMLCSGESAIIYASPPFLQYLWFPTGASDSSITVTTGGDYFLVIADSNGCPDTSGTISIITFPPVPAPLVNDTDVCSDNIVVLSAEAAETVFWYDSAYQVLDSGLFFTTPPIISEATFLVNQRDNNGCFSNFDSINVAVIPHLPPPPIIANSPVCEGDSLFFYADSTVDATYIWSGPGFNSTFSYNSFAEAEITQTGLYQMDYFYYGCKNGTIPLTVEVVSRPQFELLEDTFICEEAVLTISIPEGFDSYFWSDYSYSNEFVTSSPGSYSVTALNFPSCSLTKTFVVNSVLCDPEIPNIITPDGDGKNDYFYIRFDFPGEMSLIIFNRWGEIAGEFREEDLPWNAKNRNGKEVPDGVYYYILKFTDHFNKPIENTGFIQIVR